ncbi:VWA domain-containing protein, partial [Mariniblastus sp.]|nr:VWA domain-containing protein [Mariniblastus sp.]
AGVLFASIVLALWCIFLSFSLRQTGETGTAERVSTLPTEKINKQSKAGNKTNGEVRKQERGRDSELGTTKIKEKKSNSESIQGGDADRVVPRPGSESKRDSISDLEKEAAELAATKLAKEDQRKYSGSPSAGATIGLMPMKTTRGFFGTAAKGNHVIYVVDISYSMSEPYSASENRLQRAKNELQESIGELSGTQKFSIYFFSDTVTFDQRFIGKKPSQKNQIKLKEWLNQIFCQSGTNPSPAMQIALSEKCDEIFLLSDGDFDQGTADLIRRSNKFNTRINTISLGRSSDSLKTIAEENNGQYIEPSAN